MFRKFSINLIGKILYGGLRFLVTPILSYFLTVNDFGKIAIIFSLFQFIATISGFGLNVVYSIKYYKVNGSERKTLKLLTIYTSLGLFTMLNILVIKLYIQINGFLKLDLGVFGYLSMIHIGYSIFLIEFLLEDYKIRSEAVKYNLLQLCNSLVLVLLLIIFMSNFGANLWSFNFAYYITNSLTIFTILIYSRFFENKSFDENEININRNLVVDSFRLSFPFLVGILSSYLINYADRFILQSVTHSYEVTGVYSFGYKIGELYNLAIVTAYIVTTTPVLFKKFHISIEDYKFQLNKIIISYIGMSMFYLVVLSAYLEVFLFIFFPNYLSSNHVIQITTISFVIVGLYQLIGNVLLVNEKVILLTSLGLLISIVNIGLNFLLIPMFGMIGASYTTFISYFIVLIVYYLFSKKVVDIKYDLRKIAKIVVISSFFYIMNILINYEGILLDLLVRSILLLIYSVIIYKLRLLVELNKFIQDILNKK